MKEKIDIKNELEYIELIDSRAFDISCYISDPVALIDIYIGPESRRFVIHNKRSEFNVLDKDKNIIEDFRVTPCLISEERIRTIISVEKDMMIGNFYSFVILEENEEGNFTLSYDPNMERIGRVEIIKDFLERLSL